MFNVDIGTTNTNQQNPRAFILADLRRAETGEGLSVVSGSRRLQAALSLNGQADVKVVGTSEVLQVRLVNGEPIAFSPKAGKVAKS